MHPRLKFASAIVLTTLLPFGFSSKAFAFFENAKTKLYSESISSQKQTQNVLTESRLRFHPLGDSNWQPFVGFYKNPFTYGPTIGLLYFFGPGSRFQLLAEQRLVYSDKISAVGEGRFGLIFGDWREFEHGFFLDTYGESIYIPRLDSTPVSTLWTRLGWRAALPSKLHFDPYVQLWTRASVSQDLGEPGTEWRPGLRLLWIPSQSLVLSASAYRRFTIAPVKDNQWEALFVIQGEF